MTKKSLFIAFLAISDQYATLIFFGKLFTKWLPVAILDDRNDILDFSPFQINTQLFLNFFFKMTTGSHFGSLICAKKQ